MSSVIVLDKLAQEGLDMLEAAPGIEYVVQTGLQGEELRKVLAEHDGAICRSGVKITADSLVGNRRMKAIVRAGVGTDNHRQTGCNSRRHRRDEHPGLATPLARRSRQLP